MYNGIALSKKSQQALTVGRLLSSSLPGLIFEDPIANTSLILNAYIKCLLIWY